MADQRKEWLRAYDPEAYVDHSSDSLDYSNFIDKELTRTRTRTLFLTLTLSPIGAAVNSALDPYSDQSLNVGLTGTKP